jgi:hypothetical protein
MTLKIDITTQQIGDLVPGLDGAIYAGIAPAEGDMPQAHLVLWLNTPTTRQDYEASTALAKAVNPETDSRLPSRTESALLYATVREQIKKDSWYWTSTFYDEDKDCAFVQNFYNGFQHNHHLYYECRALAVSRFAL